MGWLENWLHELEPAPRPVAKVSKARTSPAIATPRQPKAEIKSVWFQIRYRLDGDAGEAGLGFYSVSGGVLTMCSESGKPTGKEYRLGPDDNEKVIASRLAKQAWSANREESDFNGPLHYQPFSVA